MAVPPPAPGSWCCCAPPGDTSLGPADRGPLQESRALCLRPPASPTGSLCCPIRPKPALCPGDLTLPRPPAAPLKLSTASALQVCPRTARHAPKGVCEGLSPKIHVPGTCEGQLLWKRCLQMLCKCNEVQDPEMRSCWPWGGGAGNKSSKIVLRIEDRKEMTEDGEGRGLPATPAAGRDGEGSSPRTSQAMKPRSRRDF